MAKGVVEACRELQIPGAFCFHEPSTSTLYTLHFTNSFFAEIDIYEDRFLDDDTLPVSHHLGYRPPENEKELRDFTMKHITGWFSLLFS